MRTEERRKWRDQVPVAMAWRWAAEDPFMPYRDLERLGLDGRYHFRFLELSDGEGVVYVYVFRNARRAGYPHLARRFWARVEEIERKGRPFHLAFLRAYNEMEDSLSRLAVYRKAVEEYLG